MKTTHHPNNRRRRALSAVLCLAISYIASAQEQPTIEGAVADGTPPPPVEKKAWPAVEVREVHERVLPDRKVTLQRIKNPGLADPTPPAPPPPLSEAELRALHESPEWKAMVAKHHESRLLFISATVYDHQKTLVRWYGNGTPMKSFAAWSNIDFNHFSGMGGFKSGGISYHFMMGVGNHDTVRWRARLEEAGREHEEPQAPELPVGEPGFVLVEGDPNDAEGLAPIRGLHELYKTEAARLAAAYAGRERARAKQEAYLKANPPVPQDIVINYWKVQPKRQINIKKGGDQ
jgi:hypothetical protein